MKKYQHRMSRRILCFLLFVLLSSYGCTENKRNGTPKPNIILIVTDDLDVYATQFMTKMQTRVREQGVSFTNAFVTSSVCAPSRGSILTGQFPGKCGIDTGYGQLHGEKERKTLATLMKRADYTNVLIGKYINGYGSSHPRFIPPGWDEWYALTVENEYYEYQMNENGKIVSYGNSREEYVTDVLSAKALDFIHRNRGVGPFFMFINTVAPHVPSIPAPRHTTNFNDVDITYSFEADLSDKPAWVRNYSNLNTKLIDNYFGNTRTMEKLYRDRWRTMLAVDDMIENILVELEQNGLLGNTYVIITSDNGDGLTKHIPVSAKLSPYDEGIRVPFYVLGPNLPADGQADHLVSTVDILPTLADLAGIAPFADIDGRSLTPILANTGLPDAEWRDAVFAELKARGESWPWKSSPPSYTLMRTKKIKYIEYETGEREYYDLARDPDEMDNRYNGLSTATREDLSSRLKILARGAR